MITVTANDGNPVRVVLIIPGLSVASKIFGGSKVKGKFAQSESDDKTQFLATHNHNDSNLVIRLTECQKSEFSIVLALLVSEPTVPKQKSAPNSSLLDHQAKYAAQRDLKKRSAVVDDKCKEPKEIVLAIPVSCSIRTLTKVIPQKTTEVKQMAALISPQNPFFLLNLSEQSLILSLRTHSKWSKVKPLKSAATDTIANSFRQFSLPDLWTFALVFIFTPPNFSDLEEHLADTMKRQLLLPKGEGTVEGIHNLLHFSYRMTPRVCVQICVLHRNNLRSRYVALTYKPKTDLNAYYFPPRGTIILSREVKLISHNRNLMLKPDIAPIQRLTLDVECKLKNKSEDLRYSCQQFPGPIVPSDAQYEITKGKVLLSLPKADPSQSWAGDLTVKGLDQSS
ncbi:hypothetical protein ACTXT7_007907 [Hymenolepis weldensis]